MAAPIALAIAGQADIEYANVEGLLNDWLGFGEADDEGLYAQPDEAVEVYFPVTSSHWSDGLDTVVDWSAAAGLKFNAVIEEEHEDVEKILEDTDAVLKADNVNKTLIDVLRNGQDKGFDVYLLLLWGEVGDEDAEELLDLATQAGIPVKDLTGGLDDIVFTEDPSDEADEPEPEPEEKPTRRNRGTKAPADEELTDEAEELTEADTTTVAEVVKPKRSRGKKAEPEQVEGQTTLEEQIAQAAHVSRIPTTIEVESLDDGDPLKVALVLTEDRAREIVREELANFLLAVVMDLGVVVPAGVAEAVGADLSPSDPEVTEEPAPAAPKRSGKGGRPRADGSPAQPQKKGYLVDEEGNYSRRGRGKPRKGSTVVELTKAEAEDLGLEWS